MYACVLVLVMYVLYAAFVCLVCAQVELMKHIRSVLLGLLISQATSQLTEIAVLRAAEMT